MRKIFGWGAVTASMVATACALSACGDQGRGDQSSASGGDAGLTLGGDEGAEAGEGGGEDDGDDGGDDAADATDEGAPRFDVPDGSSADGGADEGGSMPCIECALTIDSMQSGTLAVTGANIFGTATLMGQDVYALGTSGTGRFIASADSSLPFSEVSDCPILEWLGDGTSSPSILIFGWGPSDGPGTWPAGSDIQGIHLPAQYVGNPAALAAAYDIVLYLESSFQFGEDEPTQAEVQTVLDYVNLHGGGLYVSSEFLGYLNAADILSVNRFMVPLGVEAQAQNLNWGGVDGNIEFSCFPPPPAG